MKGILTAVVASAILISPAFAQNIQGGNNNNQGYGGAPGPIAAPAFPFLRLALASTG
jgi:hypothetical protein